MSNEVTLTQACDFLKSNDEYIFLTHAQPDGDTVGAAYSLGYALKGMGKKVKILCADHIPSKFSYIISSFKHDEVTNPAVVALDIADEKLLGSLYAEFCGKTDLVIDHHVSNKKYGKMNYVVADAAATCEIMADVLTELKVNMTQHITDAVFTGIVTDTGCFKFSNTTAKTHITAAKLINLGAQAAEINRLMFDTKSKSRIKIEAEVMANMEFYFGGRVAVIVLTQDMIKKVGCNTSDLDGINALSRVIEGVMIGITVREKETGIFKVSLRTNEPISASEICAQYGGGGHTRAAGCEFSVPIEEIKSQLLASAKTALEENGCLI